MADPITSGIYELVDGRAAGSDGEVVLSSSLADGLDRSVGDHLVLERPELDLVVVGVVEPTGCLSCDAMLAAPGAALPGLDEEMVSSSALIDLPDDAVDGRAHGARVGVDGQPERAGVADEADGAR